MELYYQMNNKLSIQTHILHLQMITSTKLKLLMKLLKIKHLCNQIQSQLKYYNKNTLQFQGCFHSDLFIEQTQNPP